MRPKAENKASRTIRCAYQVIAGSSLSEDPTILFGEGRYGGKHNINLKAFCTQFLLFLPAFIITVAFNLCETTCPCTLDLRATACVLISCFQLSSTPLSSLPLSFTMSVESEYKTEAVPAAAIPSDQIDGTFRSTCIGEYTNLVLHYISTSCTWRKLPATSWSSDLDSQSVSKSSLWIS